jgi:hypothetical protein
MITYLTCACVALLIAYPRSSRQSGVPFTLLVCALWPLLLGYIVYQEWLKPR